MQLYVGKMTAVKNVFSFVVKRINVNYAVIMSYLSKVQCRAAEHLKTRVLCYYYYYYYYYNGHYHLILY